MDAKQEGFSTVEEYKQSISLSPRNARLAAAYAGMGG